MHNYQANTTKKDWTDRIIIYTGTRKKYGPPCVARGTVQFAPDGLVEENFSNFSLLHLV